MLTYKKAREGVTELMKLRAARAYPLSTSPYSPFDALKDRQTGRYTERERERATD
jgi:hypothetical protein